MHDIQKPTEVIPRLAEESRQCRERGQHRSQVARELNAHAWNRAKPQVRDLLEIIVARPELKPAVITQVLLFVGREL